MSKKLDVELSEKLEPYRSAIEATIKPYIKIQLTDNDQTTYWQSKFGGLPYLPKDVEYPKSFKGEYLYLLAQINFAEISHLAGFPNRGLLQFYVAADEDLYGLDFDNPTKQDKFRVVYFPDISLQEDDLTVDFSFLPPIKKDDWSMPFEGCCALNFEPALGVISLSDYKFDFFGIYEEEYQDICDEYWDKFCLDKHKIGGHPNFVQEDPRYKYNQEQEEYILLFQIDTDNSAAIDICWGDGGIGNFFIKPSSLEKLDFSEVLYNWDCG